MGIQIPDEFYVPKYDIDSIRNAPEKDERITLFWEPVIPLCPGQPAEYSFYTGDVTENYTILIEGITLDGNTVKKNKKIKVE